MLRPFFLAFGAPSGDEILQLLGLLWTVFRSADQGPQVLPTQVRIGHCGPQVRMSHGLLNQDGASFPLPAIR